MRTRRASAGGKLVHLVRYLARARQEFIVQASAAHKADVAAHKATQQGLVKELDVHDMRALLQMDTARIEEAAVYESVYRKAVPETPIWPVWPLYAKIKQGRCPLFMEMVNSYLNGELKA